MDDIAQLAASRWRQTLAALVDVTLTGALAWSLRARVRDGRTRWLRWLPADALREQLRTPGQRLLGIATVDARTGSRVALWRTLLLVCVGVAGQALGDRLRQPEDPEADRARQALAEELEQIDLADDPDARRAAMRRAMESHAPPSVYPAVTRIMGTGLATAFINRRLRKRLAPTRQVRVRGIGPHSP